MKHNYISLCLAAIIGAVVIALGVTATAQPPQPGERRPGGEFEMKGPNPPPRPGNQPGPDPLVHRAWAETEEGRVGELIGDVVRELPPGFQPEEFREYAREFHPEVLEHVRHLISGRPAPDAGRAQEALMMLRQIVPPFMETQEQKRRDPESYRLRKDINRLERESMELAERYKDSTGAKQQELGQQLEKALGEVFDLKQSAREREVARLEKQLGELRDSVAVRKKNKSQIVKSRLDQLTGRSAAMEW